MSNFRLSESNFPVSDEKVVKVTKILKDCDYEIKKVLKYLIHRANHQGMNKSYDLLQSGGVQDDWKELFQVVKLVINVDDPTSLLLLTKCGTQHLEYIKKLLERGVKLENTFNMPRQKIEYKYEHTVHYIICKIILIKFFQTDYKEDTSVVRDSEPLDLIIITEKTYELSCFINDCACEIIQMKTDIIIDDLSIFEFIIANNITNNTKITNIRNKLLKDEDILIDKYPIYYTTIMLKINDVCLQRHILVDKLCETEIYFIEEIVARTRRICLNVHSICNICNYLPSSDIMNLITAFSTHVDSANFIEELKENLQKANNSFKEKLANHKAVQARYRENRITYMAL